MTSFASLQIQLWRFCLVRLWLLLCLQCCFPDLQTESGTQVCYPSVLLYDIIADCIWVIIVIIRFVWICTESELIKVKWIAQSSVLALCYFSVPESPVGRVVVQANWHFLFLSTGSDDLSRNQSLAYSKDYIVKHILATPIPSPPTPTCFYISLIMWFWWYRTDQIL